MKKLALVLICILMLIALVACGDKTCQHRDADDNSLCDKCGESYTDGKDVFDEHTHDYNVKNTDSQYLATAADCQNPATYYYSCSCGIKGTQIFSSGSVVAHKISGDACALCGFKNSTPGLEFSLNSDGKTYTVTGIGTCEEKNIVIGLYNNMIVTGIGDSAFEDCTSLTSITIPSSVQKVENYAFYNCSNLQTVTFGENSQLSSIGDSVFWGCTSLIYNEYDNAYYLGNETNPYLVLVKSQNTDITSISIHEKTKIIYSFAFMDCTSLTSVTIGNSVTSIGSSAFRDCTSLTSITIPDSVLKVDSHAFYKCSNLKTVTFGANSQLSSIGYQAFLDCTSLTSVTIGNSVTSIGSSAFSYCTSLRSINVDSGNKNYKSIDGNLYTKDGKTLIQYAIGKEETSFTILDGVTSIGSSAFYGCDSLTSITIPEGVTSIGSYAFEGCTSLTSITIPEGVTSIGSSAFDGCTSLTSITIPSSVQKVDSRAFYNCSNLQTVTFGENSQLSSIGSSAFGACDSLTSITIPDSVTSIGDYAFVGCTNLTSITIPDSVTSIGSGAFEYCTSLTSITIPDSVQKIDKNAFYGCSKLQTVTFGENSQLSSIGDYAFEYCTSLTSITIPSSVLIIDYCAFYDCSNLKTVTFGANSQLSSIGSQAFYKCTSLTSITIPESVTSIGEGAFHHCCKLVEVINHSSLNITKGSSGYGFIAYYALEVHKGESKIVNEDNYLFYTFEGTNYLLGYIGDDTILTLPATYNGQSYQIYEDAFYVCSSLTSITIPEGVTSIGSYAFEGCTSLTSITIPDSVTSIGSYAFYGCDSLTSIKYRGTQAQWNAISKDYGWNNYGTGNYTITYNYTGE